MHVEHRPISAPIRRNDKTIVNSVMKIRDRSGQVWMVAIRKDMAD